MSFFKTNTTKNNSKTAPVNNVYGNRKAKKRIRRQNNESNQRENN